MARNADETFGTYPKCHFADGIKQREFERLLHDHGYCGHRTVAAVSKEQIIIYTLPIVFAFSVLDSEYLSLERGFRAHFNSIRQKKLDNEPDFHIFPNYSGFWKCYFSWSVFGFYGAISIIMFAIYFVMPDIVKTN
jgi:hypothetical protein